MYEPHIVKRKIQRSAT